MNTPAPVHCLAFERLLDAGDPGHLPAAALAHARECARCERAPSRARALELALERHFASEPAAADTIPAGFTDRVMARVAGSEARGVRWLTFSDALPWWVRAAADPAVLLACAVAALVLWRGEQLVVVARAWVPAATQAAHDGLAAASRTVGLDGFVRVLADAFAPVASGPWATSSALFVGVLPVLALVAIASWRAGERLVGAAAGSQTL